MTVLQRLKNVYFELAAMSVRAAARDQRLVKLIGRLAEILPSVDDQYTKEIGHLGASYRKLWREQVRTLHAFQIQAVLDCLDFVGKQSISVADIGDSSGNHGIYLEALARPGQIARFVSVNLDPVAIEKVRAKGREAILCRAEEIDLKSIQPDLFLSFETVEHLISPIGFMHALAKRGAADYLLLSVPYVRQSRFGGIELRRKNRIPDTMEAETLHLFELSPTDWERLFLFSGFRTERLSIYRQYPRYGLFRFMQPFWKRFDFEGFAIFLLKRDLSICDRYKDWPN